MQKENLKRQKDKNCLKSGKRSDIYLTHVYRLPQSVESLKRIDKKTGFSSAVEID